MFKTFIVGIVLGAAASGAALYYVPIVDQNREHSMITVVPNGGNVERFYANVPMDRIMVGAAGQRSPLPVGLIWPDDEQFAEARTELFKIRNARDAVIGVASRISAGDADGGIIEWTLHFPARGSAYVTVPPVATDEGLRAGTMRSGTREFSGLVGTVTERWVADTSGDADAQAGRIELTTSLVASEEEPL